LNQNAKYITQFNLYNEDPPISVSLSTYPWANSFAAAAANGTQHEGLRIWKNDGRDEQVGPGGKSAWAGKNPVAVFQVVDAKPVTGELRSSLCSKADVQAWHTVQMLAGLLLSQWMVY
jgi:hypothetical protein